MSARDHPATSRCMRKALSVSLRRPTPFLPQRNSLRALRTRKSEAHYKAVAPQADDLNFDDIFNVRRAFMPFLRRGGTL